MKAKDQNGREVEVIAVGHDVVRDSLWRCYARNGTGDGNVRIYDRIGVGDEKTTGPADRLTVEKCACELVGFLPGARIAEDSEDETILESCEICERYLGDEDAAEAFVAALNREAGEDHFALILGEVEYEPEEGEEEDAETYFAVGLASDDEEEEPKELTTKAFEARCKMLKIDLRGEGGKGA